MQKTEIKYWPVSRKFYFYTWNYLQNLWCVCEQNVDFKKCIPVKQKIRILILKIMKFDITEGIQKPD